MIQIKTGLKILFVLLLVLAVHSVVWAQATGLLVGPVTDTVGAAVPTAMVTLQNTRYGRYEDSQIRWNRRPSVSAALHIHLEGMA